MTVSCDKRQQKLDTIRWDELPSCRIGLHHLAKGVAFSPASASARHPPACAQQMNQADDKYQRADDAQCNHATRARYITQEERAARRVACRADCGRRAGGDSCTLRHVVHSGCGGAGGFFCRCTRKAGNLQPLIGPNLFIPLPGDETQPKRLWPRGEVPYTPPHLLWDIAGGSGEAALSCPAKNKTSSGFG